MLLRKLHVFWGLVFLSGCLYHAKERADQAVCDLASRPYDLAPEAGPEKTMPPADPHPAQQCKSTKTPAAPSSLATDLIAAAYLQEAAQLDKRPSQPDL